MRAALNPPIVPGMSFGKWVVLAASPRRHYLRCQCACGRIRDIYNSNLRRGTSRSCLYCRRTRRHGMWNSPEYALWKSIIQRCHNPKYSEYRNYGGRGIRVCDRWRENFEHFFADVGPRPKGLTFDRIDNNRNYEPGNVRWATRSEQMLNTRLTHADRVRLGHVNAMKRWHPELVDHTSC